MLAVLGAGQSSEQGSPRVYILSGVEEIMLWKVLQ